MIATTVDTEASKKGPKKRPQEGPNQGPRPRKTARKKKTKAKTKRKLDIKPPFENTFKQYDECDHLAAHIVKAIKDNINEDILTVQSAARSIFFHEQDHDDAHNEDRINMHYFCTENQNCDFKIWVAAGNDPLEYVRNKPGHRPKRKGILARSFEEYPQFFGAMWDTWQRMTTLEKLERCTLMVTSNMNEAIHAQLWCHYVHKVKVQTFAHIQFAAQQLILIHNFTHYQASLHHVLGTMNNRLSNRLKKKDQKRMRQTGRKWVITEGGGTKHRKRAFITVEDRQGYDPGRGDGIAADL